MIWIEIKKKPYLIHWLPFEILDANSGLVQVLGDQTSESQALCRRSINFVTCSCHSTDKFSIFHWHLEWSRLSLSLVFRLPIDLNSMSMFVFELDGENVLPRWWIWLNTQSSTRQSLFMEQRCCQQTGNKRLVSWFPKSALKYLLKMKTNKNGDWRCKQIIILLCISIYTPPSIPRYKYITWT